MPVDVLLTEGNQVSVPTKLDAKISEAKRKADYQKLFYNMKLLRAVEDRIERVLAKQGKILGGVYTGKGQECISLCSCVHLMDGDFTSPTHREMGVFVARGIPLVEIFAQYMGRANGNTKGKEGNMHMGSIEKGIINYPSQLGNNAGCGVGVALSFKIKKQPNVVMTFSGEGATSTGIWHETVNFASVRSLPVVFMVNNNQYAMGTPTHHQYRAVNLAERGVGYGIPGLVVDGNDAESVYEAAKWAVDRARSGKGPSIIECKTFRMTGHAQHDSADYVPEKLFQEWAKKDPIERFTRFLLKKKWITAARIKEIEDEISAMIVKASDEADAGKFPDPLTALEGVFTDQKIISHKKWKTMIVQQNQNY
ncbi:MAG: Acetoin:2,6-dichlorophenolindophenol oxidoreductase subunit alpha [Myxococcota bacterium]|nr:Acetoin:2,6-dichlorophenolindophenol oxidoreductase subunit alpha [Myxococcota bacterium]